jgi:hypothetical protein
MELNFMERCRGAAVENQGIEEVGNNMHGLEFMEAHGLSAPADEADMEDGSSCVTRQWSDDRLDRPVHEHTKTTVREMVYAVMRICAGSVKATTMDELIKAFSRALPEDHGMPRYGAKPSGPLSDSTSTRMHGAPSHYHGVQSIDLQSKAVNPKRTMDLDGSLVHRP